MGTAQRACASRAYSCALPRHARTSAHGATTSERTPARPPPPRRARPAAPLPARRLRNRAVELISQHAGNYAAEGQKTKWIIELVAKVVLAGKAQGDAQDARIVSGAR